MRCASVKEEFSCILLCTAQCYMYMYVLTLCETISEDSSKIYVSNLSIRLFGKEWRIVGTLSLPLGRPDTYINVSGV